MKVPKFVIKRIEESAKKTGNYKKAIKFAKKSSLFKIVNGKILTVTNFTLIFFFPIYPFIF